MLKLKSLSPFFAPLALATVVSVGDVAVHSFLPQFQSSAIAMSEMSAQEKIEIITKNKGQIGGGDQLRRFFFGDLLPLGVQPGEREWSLIFTTKLMMSPFLTVQPMMW